MTEDSEVQDTPRTRAELLLYQALDQLHEQIHRLVDIDKADWTEEDERLALAARSSILLAAGHVGKYVEQAELR